MTAAWALVGVGLLLSRPIRPARRRLVWLATARLPAATAPSPVLEFTLSKMVILAGAVAAVAIGVTVGPVPGGLAGLTGWVLVRCWRQVIREREAAAEQGRLAQLVSALAAEHLAGSTSGAALLAVADGAGAWQPALVRAARLAAAGDEPATALAGPERLGSLAVAFGLAGRTGAAMSDVLARVRLDAVAECERRRAVAEAVAGPRSSAVLLSALPLIGLAMGAALGARPLHVLTRTAPGLVSLAVGVLLELAGLLWTLRLTR